MTNRKIKKYSSWKKLFVVFFIFSFLFSSVPTHPAQAWVASEIAIATATYEQMFQLIKSALLGALKQVAATTINQIVSNMVGGGSGSGPMFITDWQDYLINQPARNTQAYMNDYLTQLTRGQGSVASYVPNKAFEGTGPGSFNTGMRPPCAWP